MNSTRTIDFVIEPAVKPDIPAIAKLLREADLPARDFAEHLAHFVVARIGGGEVIGAIGMEVYESDALLRSFVVAPALRVHGVGDALICRLYDDATRLGVRRIYLLTTTAETFFAKRGFVRILRAGVPEAIARTKEFDHLCPVTAAVMLRAAEECSVS